MLPLLGVLENNDHVKHLDLTSATMQDERFCRVGNGNSNARILSLILKENTSLESVTLKNTGLDDKGLGEICDALKTNKTITKLDLSQNYFGTVGADQLCSALAENRTLKFLDLSQNALGFQSINSIICCSASQGGLSLQTQGNYVFEEVMNSVSHGIGFLVSVLGSILLMSEAADTYSTG